MKGKVVGLAVGAFSCLLYFMFNFKLSSVSILPKNHLKDFSFTQDQDQDQDQDQVKHQESKTIEPMKIDVPQDVLDDLKERLVRTRYFDGNLKGITWQYGANFEYMQKLINYWQQGFDWRKQEKKINEQMPGFYTTIDGLKIHFIHIKADRSKYPNPSALLMIHGWPGSFYEFHKIAPLLTDPKSTAHQDGDRQTEGDQDNGVVAFDLILPSIPGFGFSEAAKIPGLAVAETAAIFIKLVQRLGYSQYFVQGGDWGSLIATSVAQLDEQHCQGLHLNWFPMLGNPLLAPFRYLIGEISPTSSFLLPSEEAIKVFPGSYHIKKMAETSGYLHLQATCPDTLGFSLSDSPAGLAAWITEKFYNWSDTNKEDGVKEMPFNKDDILTNIMFYWLNHVGTTSVRFYKEFFLSPPSMNSVSSRVNIPTGLIDFPFEITRTPKSWTSFKFVNVVSFTQEKSGGHFAALERPRALAKDIQKFCNLVLKKI